MLPCLPFDCPLQGAPPAQGGQEQLPPAPQGGFLGGAHRAAQPAAAHQLPGVGRPAAALLRQVGWAEDGLGARDQGGWVAGVAEDGIRAVLRVPGCIVRYRPPAQTCHASTPGMSSEVGLMLGWPSLCVAQEEQDAGQHLPAGQHAEPAGGQLQPLQGTSGAKAFAYCSAL